MRRLLHILVLVMAFGSLGCTAAPATPKELPLPGIPSTITAPADRADYLLNHFWDELDFNDTILSRDHLFVEQAFSNFVSVFPYATPEARHSAVITLLDKAKADPTAYGMLRDITEEYLYSPDSPVYSEVFYLLFLNEYENSPLLDEAAKTRIRAQKESVMKNFPGTKAADFGFTTREGKSSTLHTAADGDILLVFFDPGCENCTELVKFLSANRNFSKAVAEGRITLLAIYSGSDETQWRRKAATMPGEWIVGIEPGTLEEEDIYEFRTMPTIYLLDKDKNVVLKDLTDQQLNQFVENI